MIEIKFDNKDVDKNFYYRNKSVSLGGHPDDLEEIIGLFETFLYLHYGFVIKLEQKVDNEENKE